MNITVPVHFAGEKFNAYCGGTFFLCAAPTDKDNFASLTEEQVQTCLKRFAVPEQFVKVGDAVFVLPAL